MTVTSDVKACLAALKGAQASLELFALETENQYAKSKFAHAAQQTDLVVQKLQSRLGQLEQDES
ncbi:DUF1657 domain-containing protein [Paenibacillus solisilvae]|uniref:DUF1657 domain-containing protein n=1 Tax=Paenibacillus solisilvae TaxID=2486751 RepID=A0ABW0VX29_9BACL